jgi:hypothetical protein
VTSYFANRGIELNSALFTVDLTIYINFAAKYRTRAYPFVSESFYFLTPCFLESCVVGSVDKYFEIRARKICSSQQLQNFLALSRKLVIFAALPRAEKQLSAKLFFSREQQKLLATPAVNVCDTGANLERRPYCCETKGY